MKSGAQLSSRGIRTRLSFIIVFLALLAGRPGHSATLVAWGDSLTAGWAGSWPTQFAALSGWTVLNEGIGGQTSTQIKDRMLAQPDLQSDVVVLWAGRNNLDAPDTIKADIATMVSAVGDKPFVILSILNGDYGTGEAEGGFWWNRIVDLNDYLELTYAGHYIDVRSMLVSSYNPALPEDVIDFAEDIPPASLRLDKLHLNAAGNALVAQAIYAVAVPEPTHLFFIGLLAIFVALRRGNFCFRPKTDPW